MQKIILVTTRHTNKNGLATLSKLWIVEIHWNPPCSQISFEQQISALNIRSHHRRDTPQLLLAIWQWPSPTSLSKNLKEVEETTYHTSLMNCCWLLWVGSFWAWTYTNFPITVVQRKVDAPSWTGFNAEHSADRWAEGTINLFHC